MVRIYIIGVAILIIAIISNFIANKLDLKTWYDLFNTLSGTNELRMSEYGFVDYLWLFLLYPLSLGLGYVIGDKLYGAFFG